MKTPMVFVANLKAKGSGCIAIAKKQGSFFSRKFNAPCGAHLKFDGHARVRGHQLRHQLSLTVPVPQQGASESVVYRTLDAPHGGEGLGRPGGGASGLSGGASHSTHAAIWHRHM